MKKMRDKIEASVMEPRSGRSHRSWERVLRSGLPVYSLPAFSPVCGACAACFRTMKLSVEKKRKEMLRILRSEAIHRPLVLWKDEHRWQIASALSSFHCLRCLSTVAGQSNWRCSGNRLDCGPMPGGTHPTSCPECGMSGQTSPSSLPAALL